MSPEIGGWATCIDAGHPGGPSVSWYKTEQEALKWAQVLMDNNPRARIIVMKVERIARPTAPAFEWIPPIP